MIEVSFSHTTAVVGEPKDRACPFVSLSPDMEPVQKKTATIKMSKCSSIRNQSTG